jgi:hypothetical protein
VLHLEFEYLDINQTKDFEIEDFEVEDLIENFEAEAD